MVKRQLTKAEARGIIENFENPLRSVTHEPGQRCTHVYSTSDGRFFAFHFDMSLSENRYIGGEVIDEAKANTYPDHLAPN